MAKSSPFKAREFTLDFLRSKPGERFTAAQIARALVLKHPVEAEEKRRTSQQGLDNDGLISQITAEIGSFRPHLERLHPAFRSSSDRPRLYFWEEGTGLENSNTIEPPDTKPTAEAELYPLLSRYLISQKNLIPMRIDEKRSSQSRGGGGNHWLHPDIVALEDSLENSHPATISVGESYRSHLIKLWSFEVKKKLTVGNTREAFFQTVSNSSWANFSYLVAVSIDEAAKEELEILCPSHRVGLIRLDEDDPNESEILIPAEEKSSLDWGIINRLAVENSDFRKFLDALSTLHTTGKTLLVRKMLGAESPD